MVLNAEYFRTHLPQQVREFGNTAMAEVHLHGGAVFRVRAIGEITESYVLLEVYPQEGVTEESMQARNKYRGTQEVVYDRVAVPYGTIAYVFLTIMTPATDTAIVGFGKDSVRKYAAPAAR
jgi:hypothetical protein